MHKVLESDLPSGVRYVLLTLGMRMNPENSGLAWPSQKRLALDMGLSERTVREHIGCAVRQGWLQKRRRGAQGLIYAPTIPLSHRQKITGEARAHRKISTDGGQENHRQNLAGETGKKRPVRPARNDRSHMNSKKNSEENGSSGFEKPESRNRFGEVVSILEEHFWQGKVPPQIRADDSPDANDRRSVEASVFQQLAKEFDPVELIGILPLARENGFLPYGPVSLRYLNARRDLVREIINDARKNIETTKPLLDLKEALP